MFYYIFTLMSKVFYQPMVLNVTKKSIMGNDIDKTMDYYSGKSISSALGENFTILYKNTGKDFNVMCYSESYNEAIKYIKKNREIKQNKRILSAYEYKEDGSVKDITVSVLKNAGPEGNFYINSSFPMKCNFITNHTLYILTEDLSIHVFINDDVIDISKSGFDIKLKQK